MKTSSSVVAIKNIEINEEVNQQNEEAVMNMEVDDTSLQQFC